jgi:tetratricopeptide (TPR) repeat protein
MKSMIIVFLAAAFLLALPGYAIGQAESEAKDLPDEELKTKFTQAKERQNWNDAVAYIKELVDRHKEKALYRYDLASTLMLKGDLQSADAEFERVLEIKPNFLEAYIGRARIYAKQNKEKVATGYMLEAARKGYPVREMHKMDELRRYLRGDVRFFLKMVEIDIPRVEKIRDPFVNPLRKAGKAAEEGPEAPIIPEEVEGDPPKVQAHKSMKMKDLLFQVQRNLTDNKEDEARKNWGLLVELYGDVELGRITDKKYREQMLETWKVAQETVYPRLREIEIRKFTEEVRAALDKLQADYDEQNVDGARQRNTDILKMLEPKQKSTDQKFVELAKEFDVQRAKLFERIKILEEFQRNVKPFLKLTALIVSPAHSIAMIESIFGGELKKISLRESDSLPRMKEFVVKEIDEERIWAEYRKERVEIELGVGFGAAPATKKP